MRTIADLHLHSKYSRAVSKELTLPVLAAWAKRKGIGLISAADFTHPLWFEELKHGLVDLGNGFYRSSQSKSDQDPKFLLSTEVSCIYSHLGQVRRIHMLLFVPSLAAAQKINAALVQHGANLMADGRPILGLSAKAVAEMTYAADPFAFVIPAHVWTPWFGLYGSESGYDSLKDCFGDLASLIPAVETGLSSNPSMNWRIAELDDKAIVSFSDAHSGPKLGREVTVFHDINSYEDLLKALKAPDGIEKTVEFHPEEGKYHYTGHRNCSVKQTPEETNRNGATCPVCGKKLTVGVMHRVEELASRPETFQPTSRPPFTMLVPLLEVIAEVYGVGVGSKKVAEEYARLTTMFANEFAVLEDVPPADLSRASSERLAEAIQKVRTGDIVIDPGYDGVFGKVSIWGNEEHATNQDQMSLF